MKAISEFFEKDSDNWFSWVPVLFACGIGLYFSLPFEPSKWITLAVIEFLLIVAYFLRFSQRGLCIVVAVAVVFAGFVNIQVKTLYLEKNLPTPSEGVFYLRGQIMSVDTNFRGRPRIVLGKMESFDDEKIKGQYRLTIVSKTIPLVEGHCVELVAEVSPLMKSGLYGGYQPDRKLFFEGINGSGYVMSSVYELPCPQAYGYWKNKVSQWRREVSEMIAKELPAEEAAVVAAIVAGNRNLMTREQVENYRDSGLAHFLSISGLHMSMIAGLMFFFVRLFMALIPSLALKYNSKKVAAILAVFISTVYLVISGMAVPTQRAYIMTFVVLLAILFERRAISMRVLALAALIILIISPQMLVSISFQLSFAAVIALVAFYERWGEKLERFLSGHNGNCIIRILRGILAYLFGIVLADFVASIATLPFAIYHFNRIALYTSLTNLIAGPLIGLMIMPAVLLALLTIPLGLSWWPLQVVAWGIGWINRLTLWVSELPQSTIEIYSFPLWGFLCIVFGGLWLCLWQQKWRYWGCILILFGSLSLFFVEVPDTIAAENGTTVAVKNSHGKLQAFSGGNAWLKEIWITKFASSHAPTDDNLSMPDLKHINFDEQIGVSIYGKKIKSVREYIGFRPWNK